MTSNLSYEALGATCPGDDVWPEHHSGFRRYERTVLIGHGQEQWEAASAAVMTWGVKTRSGFTVDSVPAGIVGVRVGTYHRLTAAWGPFKLREPVRVVAVVEQPARCGFAYGTLVGHPVSGEEAFVVHKDDSDDVQLTLRSLTQPGHGIWRLAFPAVLVAQGWYRWRYARALRQR